MVQHDNCSQYYLPTTEHTMEIPDPVHLNLLSKLDKPNLRNNPALLHAKNKTVILRHSRYVTSVIHVACRRTDIMNAKMIYLCGIL